MRASIGEDGSHGERDPKQLPTERQYAAWRHLTAGADRGGMTVLDIAAPARLESLSIVLPCYDEAPNVESAVAEALFAGARFATGLEVVIVDDGSSDDTGVIAASIAEHEAGVRVVRHDRNRGYGAAVRSGISASQGAWVLLTDGDLQFDLAELELLVPLTAEADLVAGYRLDRADPLARRVAAGAWNRLMRRSFGVGVRDVDCAFKLMRGEAARALPLTSEGAMVSTELLVRAGLAGWRIAEVGVHHRPRRAGEPTGGDLAVIARAFRERRALLRRLRAEDRGARARTVPRPQTT
jgi:glycosyltransferase involved in cell wall biosynthesis